MQALPLHNRLSVSQEEKQLRANCTLHRVKGDVFLFLSEATLAFDQRLVCTISVDEHELFTLCSKLSAIKKDVTAEKRKQDSETVMSNERAKKDYRHEDGS